LLLADADATSTTSTEQLQLPVMETENNAQESGAGSGLADTLQQQITSIHTMISDLVTEVYGQRDRHSELCRLIENSSKKEKAPGNRFLF